MEYIWTMMDMMGLLYWFILRKIIYIYLYIYIHISVYIYTYEVLNSVYKYIYIWENNNNYISRPTSI